MKPNNLNIPDSQAKDPKPQYYENESKMDGKKYCGFIVPMEMMNFEFKDFISS